MSLHSLAKLAEQVLKGNDRGSFTIPSPTLYPHQWAWDSAFAAIGWSWVDINRALIELETLMAGIWPDGKIPHIYFHNPSPDYFPGPDVWETPHPGSSITQPPVGAIAARKLYERGADKKRMKALLKPLEHSHLFFKNQRDPSQKNIVAIAHPWESGLDNSPAWDKPMQAIDPNLAPAFKRVDKDRIEDSSQRPTDDEYKRYIYLVKNLASHQFQINEWAVYDPLMTSVLILAERDLGWLGEQLDFDTNAYQRAETMQKGLLEYLWSEKEQRFGFYDVFGQHFYSPDVLSSYFPLCLNLPETYSRALKLQLTQKYMTKYPLPTTSPTVDYFQPQCYWRGPVWLNMNWFFAPFIGQALIKTSIELVQQNNFCEYFNPNTGQGLGGESFTWSAALILDWIHTLNE